MIKQKLKNLNKKDVVVISGFLLLFFVLFLINVTLKNTHAYYNYEMEPVPIFNSRVGNFVKEEEQQNIEEYLESQENSGLETRENMEARNDTLRRYQGSSVNNYICFGTKDKTECLENQGKYMYRIIGIDTITQELKIIKKEALDTSYEWNTATNVTWNNSTLYNGLNNDYFLKSNDYSYLQESKWLIAINDYDYGYGDISVSSSYNGTTLLENEKKNWGENIVNSKVNLMYVSDYYLAMGNNANCYSGSTCKTGNWLHISNNDTSYPSDSSGNEWTMSRYNTTYPYSIQLSGIINRSNSMTKKYLVRPVMYLRNSIKINGIGTQNEPFMIEETLYKRSGSTTGDTSPLERTSDVNLLYMVQNLTNPKEYVVSSNKPVWTMGYKLDKKKSNCIPKNATYLDYYIKSDGTVTFSAILSKPSQVVCRIYYSLVGADNDVVIYALQENSTGGVTFEDKKYDVVSTMPTSGYTYYKATCSNSASATNISYSTSTGFKVTTSGPNICYAYFKKN